MAQQQIKAPKISLEYFLNNTPELKAGKVELLGAFAHWMENIKKTTQETETNFRQCLEDFKNLPV